MSVSANDESTADDGRWGWLRNDGETGAKRERAYEIRWPGENKKKKEAGTRRRI